MRPGWIMAGATLGLIGMALSSCVEIVGGPPDPLDGTSWLLISLEDRDPLAGVAITAVFDAGSVHGSSGCNRFSASYRISGDRFEIREIQSTLMACIVPEGAMDQEQEFITLLGNSSSYQIADGQLQLMRSNRPLLSFVPQD